MTFLIGGAYCMSFPADVLRKSDQVDDLRMQTI